MTKDEKELEQITIVQKEITKRKKEFYSNIGMGMFFIGIAIVGLLVYTTISNERVAMINSGLEECPNYHSSVSTNTIWVKDCEKITVLYKGN